MDDELIFRSLSGGANAAEEALVQAWRRADRANEEQYQLAAAVFEGARQSDVRRAAASPPPLEVLLGQPPVLAVPRHHVVRRAMVRIAAAAAILLLGFAASELRPRAPMLAFGADEFVTGPAETATVSLRDGSVVHLAPGSRLRLASRTAAREVALAGRAYFAVANQPGSPFRIKTTAGDVTVLGTRFALEAESEDLRLVVVEGRVALSARGKETQVAAGEVGRVVKGTTLPVAPAADPRPLVGWVGNFLAFQATPLRDAAREIERQFNIRIVMPDPTVGNRTISGWFAGWSQEEVMDVVCVIASTSCSREGGVVTMRPRP